MFELVREVRGQRQRRGREGGRETDRQSVRERMYVSWIESVDIL